MVYYPKNLGEKMKNMNWIDPGQMMNQVQPHVRRLHPNINNMLSSIKPHLGKVYIKGYGHCPCVYQDGGSMGTVAYQSGKTLAKHAIPLIKKAWKNLTPEAREAIIEYTAEQGIRGARFVGRKINKGVTAVGEKAKEKFGNVFGRSETSGRISKEAEKMLKKIVKSKKKDLKKKAKKMPVSRKLPKSVTDQLSGKEQNQINEASLNMLSALLSGQGLRLM